jgi:hypothetical protein
MADCLSTASFDTMSVCFWPKAAIETESKPLFFNVRS